MHTALILFTCLLPVVAVAKTHDNGLAKPAHILLSFFMPAGNATRLPGVPFFNSIV